MVAKVVAAGCGLSSGSVKLGNVQTSFAGSFGRRLFPVGFAIFKLSFVTPL